MDMKESLHTMSHSVPTIQTRPESLFKPRSFLPLTDEGSWTMSHFIDFVKYHKLLKMLDTFASVCHHIVYLSMLKNGYLDTSKDISYRMVSKHY
jgi:hypothetical protein